MLFFCLLHPNRWNILGVGLFGVDVIRFLSTLGIANLSAVNVDGMPAMYFMTVENDTGETRILLKSVECRC